MFIMEWIFVTVASQEIAQEKNKRNYFYCEIFVSDIQTLVFRSDFSCQVRKHPDFAKRPLKGGRVKKECYVWEGGQTHGTRYDVIFAYSRYPKKLSLK